MDLWGKLGLAKEFIGSFSGLLLPVVIIVLFFVLTRAFPRLFKSSNGGETARKKVSLEDLVKEFRDAVCSVEEELGSVGSPEESPVLSGTQRDRGLDKIIEVAERDPQLGIIQLSGDLEKEVGLLAAASTRQSGKRISGARGPLKRTLEKKHLPKPVSNAMDLFLRLSDKIVRGKVPEDGPVASQTFATGLTLLNLVRRTQSVVHKVERTGVDVFSDEACTNVVSDVKGVIISKTDSGNEIMSKGIYPTANPAYYETGKKVTWEWNLERLSARAFYVDPETGEKKLAWDSSAEFQGRLVDEP